MNSLFPTKSKSASAVKFALISTLLMGSVAAFGHDHAPASITGAGIDLFERDHGFAGQILDRPVFGAFEHSPFGATLQIRRGEQTIDLRLTRSGGSYGGMIQDSAASTSIALVRTEKTGERSAVITLAVDGVEVPVQVTAPEFSNNHFHGPTFVASYKGKEVRFEFTGESCMGYSSSLAMMILGAYAHLSK